MMYCSFPLILGLVQFVNNSKLSKVFNKTTVKSYGMRNSFGNEFSKTLILICLFSRTKMQRTMFFSSQVLNSINQSSVSSNQIYNCKTQIKVFSFHLLFVANAMFSVLFHLYNKNEYLLIIMLLRYPNKPDKTYTIVSKECTIVSKSTF